MKQKKNNKNIKMEKTIAEQIKEHSSTTFKSAMMDYIDSLDVEYKGYNVQWNPNGLNVIVIRRNPIYITNDNLRNNDYLLCYDCLGDFNTQYLFECTADPKQRRDGIANLMEQAYKGNIRNHKFIPNRPAICQDNDKVWVRRFFNTFYAATKHEYYNNQTIHKDDSNRFYYWEDYGNRGINIHNPAGLFNSSLGCVIINSDAEYLSDFRPLLYKYIKAKQIIDIPVVVMQESFILKYLK